MSATSILWEETIQPGATWSHVLKRGTALRITDLEGGANVGAIFYNFECPVERYNMPDTLKAQHIARLTKGFVLYSDMGRILLLHRRRTPSAGTIRSADLPTPRWSRTNTGRPPTRKLATIITRTAATAS